MLDSSVIFFDVIRHKRHWVRFLSIRNDEWRQELNSRIYVAAETARATPRQLADHTKNELKVYVHKITKETQSSRELDDYTEVDLFNWTEKLKELYK